MARALVRGGEALVPGRVVVLRVGHQRLLVHELRDERVDERQEALRARHGDGDGGSPRGATAAGGRHLQRSKRY